MTMMTDRVAAPSHPGWLHRTETWLDNKGKGAWIAAMVLGFVFFWPIGLALVLYMTYQNKWSLPMSRHSRRKNCSWSDWDSWSDWGHRSSRVTTSSGNNAFDAYKADTLARLEQEQIEFESFLERLREAKDKAEFDQFMEDRARNAANSEDNGNGNETAA